MIDKEKKREIIKKFALKYGQGEKDTGTPAVQIALLTDRINGLRPHFAKHIHDFSGNRGLMKMIGQRKALLKYVKRHNSEKYQAIIGDLGLRK